MMSHAVTLLLLLVLLAVAGSTTGDVSTGCPDSCGSMPIRFPFGIGANCSRKGFEISCEGGTPMLAGTTKSTPVSKISIEKAEARVSLPVGYQCFNSSGNVYNWTDGDVEFNHDGVYRISDTHNHLVVLGCNTMSYTKGGSNRGNDYYYGYYTGCMCFCNNSASALDGACSGVGCCHVDIPPGLTDNRVVFEGYSHKTRLDYAPCDYSFLVEKENYTFHTADLRMDVNRMMPVWLDWAIRDNLTCDEARKMGTAKGYACVSSNSGCRNSSNGPGYVCNCTMGYEGNPYVVDGCTDIDECKHPDKEKYPCQGVCRNYPGFYDCKCPKYYHSPNPFKESCNPNFPLAAQIAIGVVGGLLLIAVIVFVALLRKQKRMMKDFFEKNGGPTLEKLNNIKLFKKEDLKPILKESNVIGKGGFGEVYKGVIGDNNQFVAVKKPINVNLAQKDQFANEIIIQSRVIHKNIVKLIGCCLEVDIPILVYEFVPKGSLDDILHGSSRLPLNLNERLHIAAESAEGLAYMHSKTSATILHGDVKPANILLNDDFAPKISDFGISRLIATDKQHTGHVIGDMSYMDPVYLQTGLLTDKSDVYSFGVVLLELLTRKKASHSDRNSLLRNFLDAYTKNKSAVELIDKDIVGTEDMKLLDNLTELINMCLNLDVHQRPKMTDIEEHLRDMVKRCQIKQNE